MLLFEVWLNVFSLKWVSVFIACLNAETENDLALDATLKNEMDQAAVPAIL